MDLGEFSTDKDDVVLDEPMFEMPSCSTNESTNKKQEYNTLEIPNVALQSIRYGVGL